MMIDLSVSRMHFIIDPTTNPHTGRVIKLHGPTYNKLCMEFESWSKGKNHPTLEACIARAEIDVAARIAAGESKKDAKYAVFVKMSAVESRKIQKRIMVEEERQLEETIAAHYAAHIDIESPRASKPDTELIFSRTIGKMVGNVMKLKKNYDTYNQPPTQRGEIVDAKKMALRVMMMIAEIKKQHPHDMTDQVLLVAVVVNLALKVECMESPMTNQMLCDMTDMKLRRLSEIELEILHLISWRVYKDAL